jgi:hypothetical protein
MAIATGTATLIAAGVGLAATGITTGMSFSQANKQKKLQSQAEAEADKMMASARARLDVNYMDALSIQKEPYELQREAMISQGTQATDAAQESERGAAAGAGRVQMAQNEAQSGIRTAMGKELTEIERLKVAEEARLRDLNVQIDLDTVGGAELAARNAQEMAAQATTQGFEGLTSAATQAANLVPLYAKTGITQDSLKGMQFTPEQMKSFGQVGGNTLGAPGSNGFTNLDFEAIQNMNRGQFNQFRNDLTRPQRNMLREYNAFNIYDNN